MPKLEPMTTAPYKTDIKSDEAVFLWSWPSLQHLVDNDFAKSEPDLAVKAWICDADILKERMACIWKCGYVCIT